MAALIIYVIQFFVAWRERRVYYEQQKRAGHLQAFAQLESHFRPVTLAELNIAERQFPYRVRADLHQAIDQLFATRTTVLYFCGVRSSTSHEAVTARHRPWILMTPWMKCWFKGGVLNLRLLGASEANQA